MILYISEDTLVLITTILTNLIYKSGDKKNYKPLTVYSGCSPLVDNDYP